jgi:hypothetical protein
MYNDEKLVVMNQNDFNGNALHIMDAFVKSAKIQGWNDAQINEIIDDAVSSDYEHFLRKIASFTTIKYVYNEDVEDMISVEEL